ncbi:Hypothetical_protein [Hexamita inflata]|uniref:Hypothetical_protein n=1 Tax=Hexamita inflata TaxID=28002 RepID=A0AA86Q8R6_9EUKA|nr:Hypothetical protein HINF_LOCUS38798 [Hexamita inflata]
MIYDTCISFCTNGFCGYQYIQKYNKYEFECIQNPKNIFNTYEFCQNNCLNNQCTKYYNSVHERHEYKCGSINHSNARYSLLVIVPIILVLLITMAVCIHKKRSNKKIQKRESVLLVENVQVGPVNILEQNKQTEAVAANE